MNHEIRIPIKSWKPEIHVSKKTPHFGVSISLNFWGGLVGPLDLTMPTKKIGGTGTSPSKQNSRFLDLPEKTFNYQDGKHGMNLGMMCIYDAEIG